MNNQTQLISPDTGTTNFSADSAGNRSSQTDERLVTTNYGYDALNRLTSISTQADPSRNVGFYYDAPQSDCSSDESYAIGRLTRITDASGETRMCYDRRGNLRRKVQVTGDQTLVIQYRYNVADRLIGITYPSGVVVDYGRDTQGRITQVTVNAKSFALPVVTDVSYLPFGPVGTISFGNGQTLSKSWDQNYWPQAIGGSALDYTFTTNDVGNITQVASVTESSQTLGYDRLDRLNEVRDQNNALIESYSYDPTGNRTQQIIGAQTTTLTYPADSHRLTAVGATPRTYDAVGNTLTGVPSVPFGAPAAYDGRNRLAGYSDVADRFDMTLSYNGRGERVARAVNRTGMAGELDGFYYNESGQLLGRQRGDEKSGGSIINEEIVWLDQTPVARVWVEDGSIQQVHAIHSDHLNTPRALASAQAQANQASGTIVWRWKLNQQTPTGSNAFGAQSATEDPDNNGTLIKFDLRFPGQQYDAATGLHYNYFRDYEAGTGRYVESDPIGLTGGASTYGYVHGRPLVLFDPTGEDAAAGAAIGCALGGGVGGTAGSAIGAAGGLVVCTPVGGVLVCSGAGAAGGAALGGAAGCGIGGAIGWGVGALIEMCSSKTCPSGSPPEGTLCYDTNPHPGTHGASRKNPHYHIFKMNQNKNDCSCHWNLTQTVIGFPPPIDLMPCPFNRASPRS